MWVSCFSVICYSPVTLCMFSHTARSFWKNLIFFLLFSLFNSQTTFQPRNWLKSRQWKRLSATYCCIDHRNFEQYELSIGRTPTFTFLFQALLILSCLLRKEVIQPHLPIRLPCYDFTLIINPTFGCVLLAVKLQTSGVIDSHGVTGGVYKARERIHRGMLIRDY